MFNQMLNPALAGKIKILLLTLAAAFILLPNIGKAQDVPTIELFEEKDYQSIPGEVNYVGEEKSYPVSIDVVKYNEDIVQEIEANTVEEAKNAIEDGYVTWIDVNGVHDEELIEEFGAAFGLSASVQEDIANTTKLPHMEDDIDYIFISLKMLEEDSDIDSVDLEQISMVLGNNYVISFQQNNDNDFNLINNRLNQKKGNLPKFGSDYLAFVLTDVVVDSYFPAIDIINEQINVIEKELLDSPNESLLQDIYTIKRELTIGREVMIPMREVIHNLANYNYPQISPEVKDYFHITYENIEYLTNIIETFNNIATDMVNYYISIYGYETNGILKFLTIFSTILFIISFVAAIYGMNLSQFHKKDGKKTGHVIIAVVMIALTIAVICYFFVIGWL
ncbi:MAG: magnesium/cobalt transporter CorA [Patescibacteria group bacterium]